MPGGSLSPLSPPRDEGRLASSGPTYRPWVLGLARRIGALVFRLALSVRVTGRTGIPRSGPVLLLGNHEGVLDGPLVEAFAGRSVRALGKADLFHGIVGRLLRLIGQIPVHRGRPDRVALREASRVLADGGALAIFPEGTRGSGKAEEIQHGAAYVLLRCGRDQVPVVPVRVVGTERAMPRGAHRPTWRSAVQLHFGDPFFIAMPTNRHSRSAMAEVAEQLREHLVAHLTEVAA